MGLIATPSSVIDVYINIKQSSNLIGSSTPGKDPYMEDLVVRKRMQCISYNTIEKKILLLATHKMKEHNCTPYGVHPSGQK